MKITGGGDETVPSSYSCTNALEAKKTLAVIEAKMTREQVAEAQRQARDWRAEPKK